MLDDIETDSFVLYQSEKQTLLVITKHNHRRRRRQSFVWYFLVLRHRDADVGLFGDRYDVLRILRPRQSTGDIAACPKCNVFCVARFGRAFRVVMERNDIKKKKKVWSYTARRSLGPLAFWFGTKTTNNQLSNQSTSRRSRPIHPDNKPSRH